MSQAHNSMAQRHHLINPAILNPEFQKWIRHTQYSLEEIAFAPLPFEGVSRQELLQQVEGFRKTSLKIIDWAEILGLVFPAKISIEQCSSKATGAYKSQIARRLILNKTAELKFPQKTKQSLKTIADLTGGFGVDSYYFAQIGARVHHFEVDKSLSQIVAHNMAQLKAEVHCHPGDGIRGVQDLNEKLALIYLDPARRDAQQNKVFRLEDCTPDILTHLEDLLDISPIILLKTSPMLDLHLGLNQLKWVTEIHVVAINNEVKEILWVIQKNKIQNQIPQVFAVNLSEEAYNLNSDLSDFRSRSKSLDKSLIYEFQWNRPEVSHYSPPLNYLYEPNAPLRKIGQYGRLMEQFPILRIGHNAHLFTAKEYLNFPGRIFQVKDKWPYTKRIFKQFKGGQYNITTRDFPQSVAQIRALGQLRDGGQNYLFFTTDAQGQKWIILCQKPE